MLNRDDQSSPKLRYDRPFEIARRDSLRTSLMAAPILLGGLGGMARFAVAKDAPADLIVKNAKIATVVPGQDFARALAVKDWRFFAVGSEKDVMQYSGAKTLVIDANGRTLIPGRLMTHGSAWFSKEQDVKWTIEPGKYADFAILSADYFNVDEEKIKDMTSVLTVLGGKVVYADAEFKKRGPDDLPVSPDWSPVGKYGGYYRAGRHESTIAAGAAVAGRNLSASHHAHHHLHTVLGENGKWNMGCPCAVG